MKLKIATTLLTTLIFLIFVPAHARAQEQHWIMPNMLDELGTTNYDQIFADENQWKNILPKVNVFSFFRQTIDREGDIILPQVIPLLQKYNVAFAVESYLGSGGGCVTDAGKIAATNQLPILKKVYDYGGQIDYLTVDGAMARMDIPGCGLTSDQTIHILVDYIKTIHATYPDIKMGIIVGLPNWAYKDTPNYWNGVYLSTLTDYSLIFDSTMTGIQTAGEKIYYVNVDNPYDYAIGTHPTPYADVKSIDWVKRILDLETQVKGYGLQFGLFYNSETGSTVSDFQYYKDTQDFLRLYKSRGGNPDIKFIESWFSRPSKIVPVTEPFSFTNLVNNSFPFPMDMNTDGKIDILDLARIVNARTAASIDPYTGPEDVSGDGKLNSDDLSVFLLNYTHL